MSIRGSGQRGPLDVHPDDLAARLALRNKFIGLRLEHGHSQRWLALRMGLDSGPLYNREVHPAASYKVRTAIVWANALNHSLTFIPHGITGYRDTIDSRMLDALGRDDYAFAAVADRLVDARRRGHLQTTLAERMDVSFGAISNFERKDPDTSQINSWQKYVRGLGGWLELVLTPFGAAEVAT